MLGGIDGALYASAGALFVGVGIVFALVLPVLAVVGLAFSGVGLLSLLTVTYRIGSVLRVLRTGEASLAEVTEAAVGSARPQGTPWGDLMDGTAARGSYRTVDGRTTGSYYLQQRWALSLEPGDRIWIVRAGRGVALYGPPAS